MMSVSLRQAFVCSEGCLILAADYSQLELRILAHLSQDAKLMQILGPNNPGKYFMSNQFNIASGSVANIITLCEMEFFNFLYLIWDHYLPLAPT